MKSVHAKIFTLIHNTFIPIPKIDVANREAHKEERRRVEQEYRENHKDYYDENGRVYNLHAISPTHQVALKNGGAE